MLTRTDDFWIAHLLRRAGFGFSPEEFKSYQKLGYEGSVNRLINAHQVDNSSLDSLLRKQDFDYTTLQDLRRWWIYRMIFSQRPLEEKMTLFWHGHFATGIPKVKNPYAMYLQNLLLRKHALGNFHQLLFDISQDSAMIVWLDNQQNRRGKPNENYAREIMELFTLGIGNYSEHDVKEAARAFTGWHTRMDGFYFNQRQHDYGQKSVLGKTGNLNGDDVVSILVKQPATAKRLATKLVRFFVFEEIDAAMVNQIAQVYLDSGYQLKPMLKALFMHPTFRSEQAYHAKIKSPAELVIGTLKTLQVQQLDGDLPASMARMGQSLFDPPNVKGWDGGPAWISTDTMMERFNFVARISGEKFDSLEGYISPSQLVYNQGLKNAGQMVDYFLKLLVDGDVPASTREHLLKYVSSTVEGRALSKIPDDNTLDAKLRGLVRLIMTLPTYQLA